MKKYTAIAIAIVSASAILSGCASPDYYDPAHAASYPTASPYPMPVRSYSSNYGVVDSIRMTQADHSNGMGAGAVVGGVVGGILGNQVGGGRGRTAATVAGAIGGAMVGNQIEQRNNNQMRNPVQIGIRMDDGSYRTATQDSVDGLQVGSRVRIDNGYVYRY